MIHYLCTGEKISVNFMSVHMHLLSRGEVNLCKHSHTSKQWSSKGSKFGAQGSLDKWWCRLKLRWAIEEEEDGDEDAPIDDVSVGPVCRASKLLAVSLVHRRRQNWA